MSVDDRLGIAVMFPPSVSGIMGDVFSSDIIRILAPLSARIHMIAVFKPTVNPDNKVHYVEMKGYGGEKWLLLKAINFFVVQVNACFHLLRISKEVDVVVFHIASGLYLLPLLLARLMGKKTIFCQTGLYSKLAGHRYNAAVFGLGGHVIPPVFRVLERISFFLAKRIIVESESVIGFAGLDRYRHKLSVAPMRVIDTDDFRCEKNLSERTLVGYIGRIDGEKGAANFAKAICRMSSERPALRYLLGGEGPLLHDVEHELRTCDAEGKTTFTGWIPHDQISRFLNDLKLFVLPSFAEGLPGTVLEAMACGTPVLATPVGGVPDVVEDGQTGFIMEDNSPECIASNVLRALDDPRLGEITDNARALVATRFGREKAVEEYRRILASMYAA